MCDHCACRDLTPIAALMEEHDALRGLTNPVRAAREGRAVVAAARP